MASAVEQAAPPFLRSQSSPDLFALSSSLEKPSGSPAASLQHEILDWKSWTDAPDFEVPSFNTEFQLDTSVFTNGRDASPPPRPEPATQEPGTTERLARRASLARSKTASIINRPRSWLSSSAKVTKDANRDEHRSRVPSLVVDTDLVSPQTEAADAKSSDRSTATSASISNLARWSWTGTSRSPSPKPATESTPTKSTNKVLPSKHVKAPPERLQLITETACPPTKQESPSNSNKAASKPANRSSTYFSKMKSKPPSLTARVHELPEHDDSCASSLTSIGNGASCSDKTSGSQSICSDGYTNTPITDESSTETTPFQRDPLWSYFKSIELEFKGFGTKPTAQRVVQIKSVLVTFLRSTATYKQVKNLNLEDIDRRATILNRWWVAILDMLNDRTQQPVPGVDRPILLEALTLLMMRPEWRQATSHFQPLAERSPSERVRSRSWTNASGSTASSRQSGLLAESAEHNVRAMFVSNLVKQMGYVVEKMSVRHAPLSLVNFAGKTCAYAFFFAPGVADILVRLWGLTPDLIRRTADIFKLPRRDTGESDDIVALFPPKLGPLGWTSARMVWDMLKQIPKMSLLVARIPWTGPWVSRWKGRDTDLFFIFSKYFHILVEQFMPGGLPLTEKARSPAFVLVQAQLLSIFDTTIHRQMAMENAYGPPLVDSIHGPDAAALAMPLPPTNLMRSMSENGLVVLLRDFLADDAPEVVRARHSFAETFAALMKGAASKTSQYNSPACFTLCDFLEEVATVYNAYGLRSGNSSYLDWEFWIEVCKRTMSSLNTMSEVRTLALLYSIWDAVAKDSRRKVAICLDWLLTEEVFSSFFNNWCPMVRAYYHRLLCWRICRDDGNATEMDVQIMNVVSTRLRAVWSHHLYLKKAAEASSRALPSTVPMSPALGKRFMIIRHEAPVSHPGLHFGFDTFARIIGPIDPSPGYGFSDAQLPKGGDSKKRWSLLGRVLSMTTGNGLAPPAAPETPAKGPSQDDDVRHGPADLSTRVAPPAAQPNLVKPSTKPASVDQEHVGSSRVCDSRRFTFRFILGWQQQTAPTIGRDLTCPRLPGPAQSRLAARARDSAAATTTTLLGPLVEESQSIGLRNSERRSSVNASVEEWLRSTSMMASRTSGDRCSTSDTTTSGRRYASTEESRCTSPHSFLRENQETSGETSSTGIKPAGSYARNAVYSGRALAEWAHVVSEFNNFVERRREEGVRNLGEVEIPQLGVEGFRKIGG
ncbi:hypothetical protein HIM_07972 [Hirsutella minnesotensis 3608]|uniref:DUF1765-domain-containing protein n=1 Tax=Hirsutella minnesotensis 3608 TaxID=1043627 RepID=A0A0F7ZT73_9HYPO|nr:hypothetical protein HIM_07972 [Hirsutella minnesotensis 3608]